MHYLMFYDVVDDYAEKRVPFRTAHIAYARKAVARGELVLGGALASPADGAVLVFRGSSPAVAEAFAAARSLRRQRRRQQVARARVDNRGRLAGRVAPARSLPRVA